MSVEREPTPTSTLISHLKLAGLVEGAVQQSQQLLKERQYRTWVGGWLGMGDISNYLPRRSPGDERRLQQRLTFDSNIRLMLLLWVRLQDTLCFLPS